MSRGIGGDIAGYGLTDWWLATFTPAEQSTVASMTVAEPIGAGLITGKPSRSNRSVAAFLTGLAHSLLKDQHREIAKKIITRAEQAAANTSTLDQHFSLSAMIEIYYRDREDPDSMARAIAACQRQIELAPAAAKAFHRTYKDKFLPAHKGYEQLAIIYDKAGKISEAINVCLQAQSQGWADDWDARIDRYAKKGMKADRKSSAP